MAHSSKPFFKNPQILLSIIRALCLCALIFASALAVDYYFTSNTFCAQGHSCDVVAKSEFGQKYGIFLPTLGLVAYTFFFFFSFGIRPLQNRLPRLRKYIVPLFSLAICASALGALLFIVVQAVEIHAFCWLCMGIDSAAILLTIPAILFWKAAKEENSVQSSNISRVLLCAGLYFLIAGSPLSWGAFKPEPQDGLPASLQSLQVPGKINVIEISSFDCPHCQKLHEGFSQVIESYGDKIHFRRLTIPLRKNRDGIIAYYCAEQQKHPEHFADCMFEKPSQDHETLLAYATECKMDVDAFKACLQDPESPKAVEGLLDIVKQSNFKGAPTVWIGQTPIIGYDSSKGMQPYIDAINQVRKESSIFKRFPIVFGINILLALVLMSVAWGLRRKSQTALKTADKAEEHSEDKGEKAESQESVLAEENSENND